MKMMTKLDAKDIHSELSTKQLRFASRLLKDKLYLLSTFIDLSQSNSKTLKV